MIKYYICEKEWPCPFCSTVLEFLEVWWKITKDLSTLTDFRKRMEPVTIRIRSDNAND
jgi:hypothetical protein